MTSLGVCKIKSEYIIPEHIREVALDHVSEVDKEALNDDGPPEKKPKLSKKPKLRGQNKSRGPTYRPNRETELCNILINVCAGEELPVCDKKNCPSLHDIDEYLKIKPQDIGDFCYNFQEFGKCPRGLSCRYGATHISPEGRNIVNEVEEKEKQQTKNHISKGLQCALRKRTYNFDFSEALIVQNDRSKGKMIQKTSGSITDEDLTTLLSREKKRIEWRDKLYLSPLTTVGNLPFRRICKEFGVDITCGEMAMCSSILQAAPQELALLKRHHTEDLFGVQLCCNNPHLLTKCGQFLEKEIEVDFIDLNLGCPIELVYKEGAGSGLLRREKVLESCVRNLSQVLAIPMTAKTRTGVYNNERLAHQLAPKFRDWGVQLLTIHGRSREQRYTKSADWDYIRQVAAAGAPLPIFGNGDIFSYADYAAARENAPELAGVMIGRGALIKPWIFTEIKEQRIWDIRSGERLDILKKYINYGLEHWGSDNKGVENTRRFLLEWLSFLYRYVPVGVLEQPPQKINERPPRYKGRDELETLMASASATDWIKISEMLLGPVPEGFQFLPKHKANSYK